MKVIIVSLILMLMTSCTSLKYASIEKQKKVQQQLSDKLTNDNSKRALRHKEIFDALKSEDEYEEVSYTKEKIDKYFETTNNRQSLDEIKRTKNGK